MSSLLTPHLQQRARLAMRHRCKARDLQQSNMPQRQTPCQHLRDQSNQQQGRTGENKTAAHNSMLDSCMGRMSDAGTGGDNMAQQRWISSCWSQLPCASLQELAPALHTASSREAKPKPQDQGGGWMCLWALASARPLRHACHARWLLLLNAAQSRDSDACTASTKQYLPAGVALASAIK